MPKADSLRAQDVLVACKLASLAVSRRDWTYLSLSGEVFMSTGETHNAVDRCRSSGLLLPSREISMKELRDLLVIAVPRIFYASRGAVARGQPTGSHAAPLRGRFDLVKGAMPLVWPGDDGVRTGESLRPIYPSAPAAARRDTLVYELLALVDVLRVGNATERERAAQLLDERLLQRRPAA